MLHSKIQGHQIFGSVEDFLKAFTIYGPGGRIGHVTLTI